MPHSFEKTSVKNTNSALAVEIIWKKENFTHNWTLASNVSGSFLWNTWIFLSTEWHYHYWKIRETLKIKKANSFEGSPVKTNAFNSLPLSFDKQENNTRIWRKTCERFSYYHAWITFENGFDYQSRNLKKYTNLREHMRFIYRFI